MSKTLKKQAVSPLQGSWTGVRTTPSGVETSAKVVFTGLKVVVTVEGTGEFGGELSQVDECTQGVQAPLDVEFDEMGLSRGIFRLQGASLIWVATAPGAPRCESVDGPFKRGQKFILTREAPPKENRGVLPTFGTSEYAKELSPPGSPFDEPSPPPLREREPSFDFMKDALRSAVETQERSAGLLTKPAAPVPVETVAPVTSEAPPQDGIVADAMLKELWAQLNSERELRVAAEQRLKASKAREAKLAEELREAEEKIADLENEVKKQIGQVKAAVEVQKYLEETLELTESALDDTRSLLLSGSQTISAEERKARHETAQSLLESQKAAAMEAQLEEVKCLEQLAQLRRQKMDRDTRTKAHEEEVGELQAELRAGRKP